MQYRRFGATSFRVSALGFGAMRLPMKDKTVDDDESIRMIRRAIDRGVNYVDTAWPYHGGKSEPLVGRALKDGYREKVKVATKLPCWKVKTYEDFDKFLDLQLERLELPYIDYYLLHSLGKDHWPRLPDLGALDWAGKAISSGRIRNLGFSFHDDYALFQDIIDSYDWAMCQIQYNFMDIDYQAGTKGLRYAASKGIPVVVMEPLLGGRLAGPPDTVKSIWESADRKRSPVGWALQWLWNQPEVSTVLSGMSSMEQLEQNLDIADSAKVGDLSAGELALFDRVRAKYLGLTAIPCTKCGYCLPCPHGVDIPGNFAAYNEGIMYGNPESAIGQYEWWRHAYEDLKIHDHDIRALACIKCGECLPKCPQTIPIPDWMEIINRALGEKGPYPIKLG